MRPVTCDTSVYLCTAILVTPRSSLLNVFNYLSHSCSPASPDPSDPAVCNNVGEGQMVCCAAHLAMAGGVCVHQEYHLHLVCQSSMLDPLSLLWCKCPAAERV